MQLLHYYMQLYIESFNTLEFFQKNQNGYDISQIFQHEVTMCIVDNPGISEASLSKLEQCQQTFHEHFSTICKTKNNFNNYKILQK